MTTITFRFKGGSGSGNFGHEGRPGKIGGSSGGGSSGGDVAIGDYKYGGHSIDSVSKALESAGWQVRTSEMVDGDYPGVKLAKVQTKWKNVQDMTGALNVGSNRVRLTVIGNSAVLTLAHSDGTTITPKKSMIIPNTGGGVREASDYVSHLFVNQSGELQFSGMYQDRQHWDSDD